ncbi:MAG: zinc ribbon domain-containing protein [Promethearchaeota archaeon]
MHTNKKFAYCSNCEKEIFKPKRKSIENMYINIWILAIISSLGFAIIPFLIYRFLILKRNICPNCKNELNIYNSHEEIPDPKAQINRIVQSIENEKRDKEKTYCPYCKQEVLEKAEICPSCGADLME